MGAGVGVGEIGVGVGYLEETCTMFEMSPVPYWLRATTR